MKIFPATELRPTNIPIESVMKEGKFEIYPDVQRKGYFNILFQRNNLVLTAGEYIGLIPLNDDVAINVQPKVPLNNLIHIFSKSGEEVTAINFERGYIESQYFSPNIFEFIIESFLNELKKIGKYGVYRKYESLIYNDSVPKGKFLFKETMKNYMRYQEHKISYTHFILERDIPENRCIKYALWFILNYFKNSNYEPRNLVKEAAFFYPIFKNVYLDKNKEFLSGVEETLKKKRTPNIREYYNNILKISLFVINQSSIDVECFEEDVRLPSFVINMSVIFEKYLLNILKEGVTKDNTRVLDGNTSVGMKQLFSDKTSPPVNPDIVIKKDGVYPLIIDVKYKDQPKRDDLNQIITYCLSYDSKQGLLICPKKLDKIGEEYIGEISGIKIYVFYYNLENKDIKNEEKKLIDYIIKRSKESLYLNLVVTT